MNKKSVVFLVISCILITIIKIFISFSVGYNNLLDIKSYLNEISNEYVDSDEILSGVAGAYLKREALYAVKDENTLHLYGAIEYEKQFEISDEPNTGVDTIINLYGIKGGEKILLVEGKRIYDLMDYTLLNGVRTGEVLSLNKIRTKRYSSVLHFVLEYDTDLYEQYRIEFVNVKYNNNGTKYKVLDSDYLYFNREEYVISVTDFYYENFKRMLNEIRDGVLIYDEDYNEEEYNFNLNDIEIKLSDFYINRGNGYGKIIIANNGNSTINNIKGRLIAITPYCYLDFIGEEQSIDTIMPGQAIEIEFVTEDYKYEIIDNREHIVRFQLTLNDDDIAIMFFKRSL